MRECSGRVHVSGGIFFELLWCQQRDQHLPFPACDHYLGMVILLGVLDTLSENTTI